MINYNNLGTMIEAVRKRRKLSITDLLNDNEVRVCERQTYAKIRNNIVLNEKKIYIDLLTRLGYREKVEEIDHDFSNLWIVVDNYNVRLIKSVIDEMINDLDNMDKNGIYYLNLVDIFNLTIEYFVNNKRIDSNDSDFLMSINNVYGNELKKVILLLLGYNLSCMNDQTREIAINMLLNSDEYSHRLRCLKYFLATENYYDALIIQKRLDSELSNVSSIIQRLDFLDASTFLEFRTNAISQKYVELFKEVLSSELDLIPATKYIQYFGNLGITALLSSKYDDAILSFNKIVNYESKRKMSIYIYLIFCYLRLNCDVPKVLYTLKSSEDYSMDCRQLYYYFVEKQNNSNKQNRALLLSLIKKVSKKSKVYIKVIEIEMYYLCADAKKYTDYYKLIEIMGKRGIGRV